MNAQSAQREPVSIALVDDDRGLRESLRILVEESEGFHCVGAYGSAEEAFRSLDTRTSAPDVILLDIRLPGEPGSRAVRRFVDRFPGLAVIMLTLYAEDELIFEALCNGASGYLLKKTPPAASSRPPRRLTAAEPHVARGGAARRSSSARSRANAASERASRRRRPGSSRCSPRATATRPRPTSWRSA
jgi:DNA-binding NarL/FixJ family response regulator